MVLRVSCLLLFKTVGVFGLPQLVKELSGLVWRLIGKSRFGLPLSNSCAVGICIVAFLCRLVVEILSVRHVAPEFIVLGLLTQMFGEHLVEFFLIVIVLTKLVDQHQVRKRKGLFHMVAVPLMNLIVQKLRLGLINAFSVVTVCLLQRLHVRVETVHSFLSFRGQHVLVAEPGAEILLLLCMVSSSVCQFAWLRLQNVVSKLIVKVEPVAALLLFGISEHQLSLFGGHADQVCFAVEAVRLLIDELAIVTHSHFFPNLVPELETTGAKWRFRVCQP